MISDSEIGRIAKGASISFAGRVVGAVFKYLAQLIIALWLGAEVLGHYALGLAVYQFGELASGLGLPNGVVRFVSKYAELDDLPRLKGALVRAVQVPLVSGTIVGSLMFFTADYLAIHLFGKPNLRSVLKIFGAALPFGSSMLVAAYATTSEEISQYLVSVQEIIQPGVNLLLLLAFLWLGLGLQGTAAAWVGACFVGLVAAVGFLTQVHPVITDQETPPQYQTRRLVQFSVPLALGNASWLAMLWTDILVLGFSVSASEVGIYRAVSQTALTMPLFLTAINTILGPMIARHYEAGDISKLQSAFRTATRWTLLLSLPLYLLMISVPGDILRLFGSEFRTGALALVTLATGQLINSASGGVGYVLMMSGRQVQKMMAEVAFAVVNILLNLVFVPRWGILGAAAATGLSIAGMNVTRALQVHFALGIHAYSFRYLKLLVAGGLSIGACISARNLLSDSHFVVTLATSGFIITVVYFSVLWIIGFEEEDQVVVRQVKERLTASS